MPSIRPHIALRRTALQQAVLDGRVQCPVCKITFKTEHACSVHLFHRYSRCKITYARHLLAEKQKYQVRANARESFSDLDAHSESTTDDAFDISTTRKEVHEAVASESENERTRPIPLAESTIASGVSSMSESEDDTPSLVHDETVDRYDGAAQIFGKSEPTFTKLYSQDKYASYRQRNPFYPFSCLTEWEIAHWLARAGLSQDLMNDFFKLKYVCTILYFTNALLNYRLLG